MFFLRQEWRDVEEGIETVLLHWTTTRLEHEPNWKRSHNATVLLPQPGAAPLTRASSIWVTPPFSRSQLLDSEPSATPRFLLHTFREVIQRGRQWSTEVTRQEIRATSVTHSDDTGEYPQAFLYYSLDNFTHVNRLPMWLDGLPRRDQLSWSLPDHRLTEKEFRMWGRRESLVARLPLPHVFYGYLWGPVGARAVYSVYFRRPGIYNPFSAGGVWLWRNGQPWEARL